MGQSEPTFAQLRATYAQDQYVNNLGKFNSEDPKRQSRLTFANLRENRAARRDLVALHTARAHAYGERDCGQKSWYTDKAGVAQRLKSQDERRKFRMGLKANMEFWTQLRIGDLRAALTMGDPEPLRKLPVTTTGTVKEFQKFFMTSPVVDVLKLIVPHKADAVVRILNGIELLADFNQRLNCHLASHQALEPILAVLCDMLRSGEDFTARARHAPLAVAAQAVQHTCSTPDEDASFPDKKKQNRASGAAGRTDGSRPGRGGARRGGGTRLRFCCFNFQNGPCTRSPCPYRHVCDNCGSSAHGRASCQRQPGASC